jgi:hypothetical protein
MTDDSKTDDSNDPAAKARHLVDDAVADPVAVVLMLQQEAGNRQHEDKLFSAPLKQAAIKERVLRRMLENSLEPAVQGKRPNLTIVK